MKALALLVVRAYQGALSPYLPTQCRYDPSCSQYAYDAIEQRGVIRGGWLALRRLARCHPLCGGGYDPVT